MKWQMLGLDLKKILNRKCKLQAAEKYGYLTILRASELSDIDVDFQTPFDVDTHGSDISHACLYFTADFALYNHHHGMLKCEFSVPYRCQHRSE